MVRWVDPTLQTKVTYRAGDTMICVPPKSGTTWTMNIYHQLVSRSDPDFEDIYAEVPWVEFKEGPEQPDEELLERWTKMASPRGFKTHSFPNTQPGGLMEYREDLKYLVVVRNPEEALVSFKPFLQSFNPKLFDYWQVPELRELLQSFPDFPSFFEKYLLKVRPSQFSSPFSQASSALTRWSPLVFFCRVSLECRRKPCPLGGRSPCSGSTSSTAGGLSSTRRTSS